jgi:hypothetical protein
MGRFYSALIGMAALAALAIVAFTESAAANEYPWCAQYSSRGGGSRNCGFVSWEQCMQTVRGMGGACEPNAFYSNAAAERPAKCTSKHHDD